MIILYTTARMKQKVLSIILKSFCLLYENIFEIFWIFEYLKSICKVSEQKVQHKRLYYWVEQKCQLHIRMLPNFPFDELFKNVLNENCWSELMPWLYHWLPATGPPI